MATSASRRGGKGQQLWWQGPAAHHNMFTCACACACARAWVSVHACACLCLCGSESARLAVPTRSCAQALASARGAQPARLHALLAQHQLAGHSFRFTNQLATHLESPTSWPLFKRQAGKQPRKAWQGSFVHPGARLFCTPGGKAGGGGRCDPPIQEYPSANP